MTPNIPSEDVSTIVTAVVYENDGATLSDIVRAFTRTVDPEDVQRWVDELVAADVLGVKHATNPVRYVARSAARQYLHRSAVPPGTGEKSLPAPAAAADESGCGSKSGEQAGIAKARRDTLRDGLMRDIVGHLMQRESAKGFIQQAAARQLPEADSDVFVAEVMNRLDGLTLGQCVALSVAPEQYAAWRKLYFPQDRSAVESGTVQQSHSSSERTETGTDRGTSRRSKPGADAGDADGGTLLGDMAKLLQRADLSGRGADDLGASDVVKHPASGPAPLSTKTANVVGKGGATAVDELVPGGLGRNLKLSVAGIITGGASLASYFAHEHPWLAILTVALVVVIVLFVVRQRIRSSALKRPHTSRATAAPSQPNDTAAGPATRSAIGILTSTWFLATAAAVVVIIAALAGYRSYRSRPPNDAVTDHLVAAMAPLPVRVIAFDRKSLVSSSAGSRITYEVRFETTAPLYRQIDTLEYLRAHFSAELAAIEAADALLAGPNGGRIRSAIGTAANAPTVPMNNLAGTATMAPAVPAASAAPRPESIPPSLRALVLLSTQTPPGASAMATGQLVAWQSNGTWAFSGNPIQLDHPFVGERKPERPDVYVTDAPPELARLKTVLAQHAAYAAVVQTAAVTVAAELERTRQQRIAAYAELLRPQTLFAGTASGVGTPSGTVPVILEITSSTASRVTAMLHNDGGWADGRVFQGEWSVPAAGDACSVVLRTGRDERIDGAGPLLEDKADRVLTLDLALDGTAVAMPGGWTFHRIDPANAPATKAELSRAIVPAVAATKPGLLYRGTVTSRTRNTTETLMLRFNTQTADGTRVEASLLSPTNGAWTRPFRGGIVDNTYRAGNAPIRLQSRDAERVPQALSSSMLALATGNNSVGLNLRVERSSTGSATESRTQLVGQDDLFTYVFEPADPSWTAAPAPSRSIGNAAGGTVGAFAGRPDLVPASGQAADAPAVAERPLPPFPGEVGAYVLSDDGQWLPLPRNNGQVNRSLVQKLNGFFAGLKQTEAKFTGENLPPPTEVTANAMFDGATPVPTVAGDEVVVIYAGSLTVSQAMLARYPQLALEPVVEMAPLWSLDNGNRTAPMTSPVKNVFGFGPLRVPVAIERPTLAITLVRCTAKLPPRHYAFAAGDYMYELAVR